MPNDERPLCIVIGIGPGTGLALARKFSQEGHRLAFTARSAEHLRDFESQIPESKGYVFDVTDVESAEQTLGKIRSEQGSPAIVIYNTGPGSFSGIDDTSIEQLQSDWESNTRGLFAVVKAVLPDLRSRAGANLMVMGATAALRGGAGALPFAAAKSAQRSLAQSLARQLGPEKIHVSYFILDGVINTPEAKELIPDAPPEFFLDAAGIAEAAYAISQQPEQAWSFEVELRPYGEKW